MNAAWHIVIESAVLMDLVAAMNSFVIWFGTNAKIEKSFGEEYPFNV